MYAEAATAEASRSPGGPIPNKNSAAPAGSSGGRRPAASAVAHARRHEPSREGRAIFLARPARGYLRVACQASEGRCAAAVSPQPYIVRPHA
jgi:hypothetical protein